MNIKKSKIKKLKIGDKVKTFLNLEKSKRNYKIIDIINKKQNIGMGQFLNRTKNNISHSLIILDTGKKISEIYLIKIN